MSNEYGFFASKDHDRCYSADDFSAFFGDFFTDGVLGSDTNTLKVSAAGDMTVSVAAGTAYIKGRWYRKQSSQLMQLGDSDTVYDRIDAVVIRCDYEKRMVYPYIIEGIPDETAVEPEPVRNEKCYDIVLAYVHVAANCVEVTSADITDKRGFDDLCGFVTSAVDHIDTSGLFRQYEAQWELLKAGCAQNADAVIAAWDALNTTKAVNGITPEGGNVKLTQSNIPSDDIAYQMKYFIQSGTVTVDRIAGSESGGVNIVFPKKFKTAPLILLSATDIYSGSTATNNPPAISYKNVTAEGFTVKAYAAADGGMMPSGWSATVSWVALGQLLYAAITKQPTDRTVGVGEKAAFSVSAIGNGITYLWQYSSNGGQTWKNFNVTTSSIVITNGSPAEMLIRCIVTDEFGRSVTSDAAKLIVTGG